jgi:hypothetical protein
MTSGKKRAEASGQNGLGKRAVMFSSAVATQFTMEK